MTATQTKRKDELFTNLKPGNTAYQCTRCGHYVGDPRATTEWVGHCPLPERGGCGRTTTFKRVNR